MMMNSYLEIVPWINDSCMITDTELVELVDISVAHALMHMHSLSSRHCNCKDEVIDVALLTMNKLVLQFKAQN